MTRRADLWRSVSLALVFRVASFRLNTVPLVGKDSLRGGRESATGRHHYTCCCTAEPGERCRHPRIQQDGSASSKVSEEMDKNDDGRNMDMRDKMGLEKTDDPLVEYFAKHEIESAEIVPVHLNGSMVDPFVEEGSSIMKMSVNVKTVIFQAKGKPFAAVMRRELVADPARMARHFRLPTRQITLAGAHFVEELTGFSVGTIPPLGHRIRLPTLVDAELLDYSKVIGGGGRRGFHLRISVDDLVKATAASVVPLARPKIDPNGNNADIPLFSTNSTASVALSSTDVNSQSLRRPVLGDVSSPVWGDRTVGGENGALVDGRTAMRVAADTAGRGKVKDRLRVVAAAVQTVAAALSLVAVSLLEAFSDDGQGRDFDQALSSTVTPDGRWDAAAVSDDRQQRHSEDLDAGIAETRLNSGSMPGNLENGLDEQARPGTDSGRAAKAAGDEIAVLDKSQMVLQSTELIPEEAGRGRDGVSDALWRVAGTPTLDAISGDVHLVALVAGKRSLTRLLHFVDLVPPTDVSATAAGNPSCLVRKAWLIQGTGQDHPPRPVQVQLIMGKALVDRLGEEDARVAMRGVKRGQLLYVTGRPTRDTRLRFSEGDPQKNSTAILRKPHGDLHGTYDLVCCSMRMLEDAPEVDPEMVGKGDDWSGGDDWLKMDLDEQRAVAYVDSSRGVREMSAFLKEALVDPLRNSAGDGTLMAESRLALAVDCEWRPGTRAGAPQNPVSLMQLAIGDRVFIVDMLHVCRCNSGGGGDSSKELTEAEALLEEALGDVLRAPRLVKVGVGPKADFQSLMRSFPHLQCFRRVCGVVNLIDLARNAASLKKTPAEEKGSLSRLSNLVLGKPLDKSEQCSDWGTRPLSQRQKRYAALDARATLLLYQRLAPEVPAERMETLFSTLFYDDRAHGIMTTQSLSSYASYATAATTPRAGKRRRRAGVGGRRRRGEEKRRGAGGRSRQSLEDRKVSEVELDVRGLGRNWLGRTMPGLTKEGVVRECISPGSKPSVSVLRFDRHLSFVEFQNGYALLMNCGGSSREREHASGFLNKNGSLVAWYLQGRLTPERASHSFGDADSNAIERFLERIEAVSGSSWSISGGLPDNGRTLLSDAAATTAEGKTASSPNHELVLFARSKGRPFVYCGAVNCVAQEFFALSTSGSSRLGAVRFTLELRDWRRASGMDDDGNVDNGEENAFRDIVREGLKLKLKSSMYK